MNKSQRATPPNIAEVAAMIREHGKYNTRAILLNRHRSALNPLANQLAINATPRRTKIQLIIDIINAIIKQT